MPPGQFCLDVWGVGPVGEQCHRLGVGVGRRQVGAIAPLQLATTTILVVGVGLGWLGASGTARFLAAMLYGVSPGDQMTFATVAALLGAVAVVAALVPGLRAALADPVEVVRAELGFILVAVRPSNRYL